MQRDECRESPVAIAAEDLAKVGAKAIDIAAEKAKKKKSAEDEYEEHLSKVLRLKEMTDTKAWRAFFDAIVAERKRHEQDILTEDKTRAMVADQEAIKFINSILTKIQKPIDDLNNYCSSMPLFVREFHTRAVWNSAIGAVELSESR